MGNHDPQDLEYVARLAAAMLGFDPDSIRPTDNRWARAAALGLDHLAKTGAKVTTRDNAYATSGVNPESIFDWAAMHDAAPLTPRTPRDET